MAVTLKAQGATAGFTASNQTSLNVSVPATDVGDLIILSVTSAVTPSPEGVAASGYADLGGGNDPLEVWVLGRVQDAAQGSHTVTVTFSSRQYVRAFATVYTGAVLPTLPALVHLPPSDPASTQVQWPSLPQAGVWHLFAGHYNRSTVGPYGVSGTISASTQVVHRGPHLSLGLSTVSSVGGGYPTAVTDGVRTNPALALLIPGPPPPSGEFANTFAFGAAAATGSSPSKAGFSTAFDFGPASAEGQAPESGGAFRTKFSFNPTVEGQTDVSGGFVTNFTFIPTFEARGFVTVATLNNQTALVVPRNSGQILRLNLADTITVAEQPVRVYGSGELQVGSGWWDDILIVNGNYTGPWFDGSHLPAGLDPDTHRVRWVGAQNASTSLYETRTFSGNPAIIRELQSGPWMGGMGHSGVRFEGVPTFIANTGVNGGQAGYAATFREVGSWDF